MGVMGARRLSSVLVVLCVLTFAAMCCVAPAWAVRHHIFSSSFGGPGSGNGQLSEPSGVAVNETTGDVYVVDKGNDRVEEFTSAGVYVAQFDGSGTHPNEGGTAPTGKFSAPEGIAVDNSTDPLDPSAGEVYVVDAGHKVIDKFTSSGGYVGQITEGSPGSLFAQLYGVAVDQNGTLWVFGKSGTSFQPVVVRYSDAGANEFISEVSSSAQREPRFAVDSEGNSYQGFIDRSFVPVIQKFSSTYSFLGTEVDPGEYSTAVAVNLSNNDAYIDNATSVGVFSPTGTLLERIGSEHLKAGTGLTVSSSSGTVYVADSATDSVEVFELEPFSQPVVEEEGVSDVASTSATLDAQVNPRGSATEYWFEYGPTSSYGTRPPLSGGTVAAGFGANDVSVHVQELLAGTTYHYRVVARNELGTVEGTDRSFTTQATGTGLRLLDGREWELVSPANKKGALVEPFTSIASVPMIEAAVDGSGIAYYTTGPNLGEHPQANAVTSPALSRRTAGVWRTEDLTLPVSFGSLGENSEAKLGLNSEYFFFSPDLSSALAEPHEFGTPPLSPEATERTPYVRDDLTGAFTPLVTPADVVPGVHFGGEGEEEKRLNVHQRELEMHMLGATPDLHHVVLGSALALTPGAVATEPITSDNQPWNLYEWNEGEGLQLVNILPNGEQAVTEVGGDGMFLGGEGRINNEETGSVGARTLSNDGRWVAWTWSRPYPALQTGEWGGYHGLYVRDTVAGRTYRVGGPHALYQSMNSDGSRIFYLEDRSLYVFEPLAAAGGVTTDLTGTLLGAGEHDAGVRENMMGTSEDGSYAYFVAKGVLAAGGGNGGYNLYVAHAGAGGWSIGFVATLGSQDWPDWWSKYIGSWPSPLQLTSRVSPDGRYLTFMSERSLTGYDNIDAVSGKRDEEVYLFDAAGEGGKGKLACVSCNPTGARPVGVLDQWGQHGTADLPLVDRVEGGAWSGKTESGFPVTERGFTGTRSEPGQPHWLAGSLPPWYGVGGHGFGTHQPRYLSDSGRMFFNSPDALVPQDSNGLEDVYEYEPAGVGSCTTGSTTFHTSVGGCVDLISSGTSSEESDFFDASENGDDVFFITRSKLVSADYDASFDVYDAHVCSASAPCVSEPVVPSPCTSGDSCKAAPAPQPEIFGPAPSATFSGQGNVTETAKPVVVKARSLTRAQKLARALRACQKLRGGSRRASCERQAHKRYVVKRSRQAGASRKGQG
jgi:NHL repeat/WD40-like Beta Propeller Repeat